jgi:hypothetical protein
MINLNAHEDFLFSHRKTSQCLTARGQYKKSIKGAGYLLPFYLVLLVCALLVYAGCNSSYTFSDSESVKLVKNYYLFYHEGREVEARVMHRGEYMEDCECYPLTFEIRSKGRQRISKTFYFFRDQAGKMDIRVYRKRMIQ